MLRLLRTRRRTLGGAAVIVAVCAALSGSIVAATADSPQDRLLQAARDAAATGRPLNLEAVAGRSWQRVGVFSDYDTRDDVERVLGATWPEGNRAFRARDYTFHLVFVRERRVVSSATVDGLVACLLRPGVYTRAAAAQFRAAVVEDDVMRVTTADGNC